MMEHSEIVAGALPRPHGRTVAHFLPGCGLEKYQVGYRIVKDQAFTTLNARLR